MSNTHVSFTSNQPETHTDPEKTGAGGAETTRPTALRQTRRFLNMPVRHGGGYLPFKQRSVRFTVVAVWQPKQHLAVSGSGVEKPQTDRALKGLLCGKKTCNICGAGLCDSGSAVKSRRLHLRLL